MIRVLAAISVVSTLTTGCSDDDGDHGGSDEANKPDVPSRLADLEWQLPFNDTDITACRGVAVFGEIGETPQVVHVADDRVVTIDGIDVAEDAELQPTEEWNLSARCQDTVDGDPVVIVEAQPRLEDIEDETPSLYAGFDVDGKQLWAHEAAAGTSEYDDFGGYGAFVLTSLETDEHVLVDAGSGEVVGSLAGGLTPPTVVSPELLLGTTKLLSAAGEELTEASDATLVGADRILLSTNRGVELRTLPDLAPVWRVPGVFLPFAAERAIDPTTGIAVVQTQDQTFSGVDLETGDVVWTGVAPLGAFGLDRIGGGVLTMANDDFTEQQVVDTATGEVLPAPDGYVIPGPDYVLLVDDEDTPQPVTVEDLR